MFVSTTDAVLPDPVGPARKAGLRGKTGSLGRHQQGMTLKKARGSSGCSAGPPLDVQAWRRCRLLEAGLPVPVAEAVAADPGFDLHALLELVDRGCPPLLAVRIVSPLPRGTMA